MELSKELEKIDYIYTYKYDENIIKEIIDSFILHINNNIYNIMQKIDIDSRKGMTKNSIDHIRESIKKISNEAFLINQEKYNNKQIDGIGNIAVLYDGNPYVTISLAIKALKTHNNIIFFSKNIYETNDILINILKEVIEKCNYYKNAINLFENVQIKELKDNQHSFDKIIIIDDKYEYIKYKNMFDIPSTYNGYGNVSVYVDDEYFKNTLRKMDEYVYENNIKLDYYNNEDIEKDIEKINDIGLNDIAVIFTKNSKKAFDFINRIKSKKMYINKNPFDDYTFDFSEDELVFKKEIYK